MSYRYTYGPSLSDQGVSPDDIEFEDVTECPECDEELPVNRETARRLVGYPDEKLVVQVRQYRLCPNGHRVDDEGGWYEEVEEGD